jgi:GAF domain-containing protein
MATTWPGRFKKNSYSASVREGLTGWVLSRATPVKIFDLAHFEQDKTLIRRDYPNLLWRDSLDIKKTVGGFLQITRETELPPLSFMAVPVMMGEKVVGVIRCCTAKQGPYYFADRELNLLKPIASQIAGYMSNWMSRREMQQENESWRSLVQSVSRLNTFVHKELTLPVPDELRIFDEAMRVTKTVIDGAEIMDVRLLDEERKELYFAKTYGQAWRMGDESEIAERQLRRFSVRGNPTSAGAKAFQTGQVYMIRDVDKDHYYSETFPATRRMIIAPISVENEIFGVLDIRRTSASPFPKHAEEIAELLGHQLGLYRFLARNIGRLRNAEIKLKANITELERMRDQQAQTFEGVLSYKHTRAFSLFLSNLLPSIPCVKTSRP